MSASSMVVRSAVHTGLCVVRIASTPTLAPLNRMGAQTRRPSHTMVEFS
ncbi:unannotated protein [freshwater metagenome]|uniref:Unannotated protein n=1 Tax=freshwater metagenome TaxID=449393 RepID=A0A6J7JG13_9ZZZZ